MADTITVTHDGSEFEFEPARLSDIRFTMALADISDETVDERDTIMAYGTMVRVLFGEHRYAVLSKLENGDGIVTSDAFNGFFADLLEQAKAKNS